MNNVFVSQSTILKLTFAALLVFLARTFIDYQYVYSDFGLNTGMMALTMLINLALFGGWIWGLLAMVHGSRRWAIAVLGINLFFLLVVAVGTQVAFCPSPCQTAWPLAEIANWLSLILGILATVALAIYVRQDVRQTEGLS